jgi:hypothetical protein
MMGEVGEMVKLELSRCVLSRCSSRDSHADDRTHPKYGVEEDEPLHRRFAHGDGRICGDRLQRADLLPLDGGVDQGEQELGVGSKAGGGGKCLSVQARRMKGAFCSTTPPAVVTVSEACRDS